MPLSYRKAHPIDFAYNEQTTETFYPPKLLWQATREAQFAVAIKGITSGQLLLVGRTKSRFNATTDSSLLSKKILRHPKLERFTCD